VAEAAVTNAAKVVTFLVIAPSPTMSVIIAAKKATLVVIVMDPKKSHVTSAANEVIWLKIVTHPKMMMAIVILDTTDHLEDQVLGVISAESPVIYRAIALIMKPVILVEMVVETVLSVENPVIMPGIVMITMMILVQLLVVLVLNVISVESPGIWLVIVHQVVVVEEEDIIVAAVIMVVVVVARHVLAVVNTVIIKEIVIRIKNATPVVVLAIKARIARYREVLKSATNVNRKDIFKRIVQCLIMTRNYNSSIILF